MSDLIKRWTMYARIRVRRWWYWLLERFDRPDDYRCEGCHRRLTFDETTFDVEGCPLCDECAATCLVGGDEYGFAPIWDPDARQ